MSEFPDRATYDRANCIGRDNWLVSMTVAAVRSACGSAAQHHGVRRLVWLDSRDEVKAKLGDEGLRVREQQVTGGARHDVVLDPQLVERLQECERKAAHHLSRIEELERFGALLASAPQDSLLVLTAADAQFFELGKHELDDKG